MEPQKTSNNQFLLIPLSILIAGAFIAFALFKAQSQPAAAVMAPATNIVDVTVAPVTSADHILGSPNAPVTLVEYSDLDCPYCQRFHPIVQRIIDNYGKDGKVAWVYRHFAFHPNAPHEAEASECVAELGGNNAFWKFVTTIFEKQHFPTSADDKYVGIDPKDLPTIAASAGVDRTAFNTCLNSGKYTEKIKTAYNDALSAGATGTPHTVVISKKALNKEAQRFIDTANHQYQLKGQGVEGPFTMTSDNKMVIVNGALDYNLLSQLIQVMIQSN